MLVEHSVVCPVLVGRAAPLSTVSHTLDRARSAHGGTLLVSGEAGIGKSRLVRAMTERARELGFVTLQGACFEADRAHPYAPLLDLVRALSSSASPALAAHYFEPAGAELVTLFPELRSIFADVPERRTLDPEEERRRLFHSFTEAVQALGKVQPLLLVLEDVHWSDDATLDLVLHLARRIGAQPIAVVLTFRSDEIGARLARLLADLDRARCASEIGLRPLGASEVSAMLQAIFGPQVAVGPSFLDGLHDLTEGNPFFVEEMLKALLVAGDLFQADGVWRARPLEQVRVPRTATEAVERRLAGLSDEARRVASVAAVAGRRFDFGLLQRLTRHDESELLALVKELVAAQLVAEESADIFAFRHALTREAMRAQLLARERVALHRAIAAALEEQYDDHAHDVDDALAYHMFEAGEWGPARRYALRAAARATTLCAPREALQQLDRAVTATEHAGIPLDAELLVARGRTHETLGAFSKANDDFGAALATSRASGDRHGEWSALHALGMLWAARDYDRAGRFRHEALEVARATGEPPLIARSLNRVGNWYVNRDEPNAGIPYHQEALAIFEQTHDGRGVAETVDLLAMSHHIAGAEHRAVELYERSIALFTELGDRRGLANALSLLAACGPSFHSSSVPVSSSALLPSLLADERAVRLAREIGWRAGEAFALYLLADALAWRGEYGRALSLVRSSLSIAQEIEHLEWQCGALRVRGVVSLHLCATQSAIADLEAAHDIARRLASDLWIKWTGAPLAIALCRAGRWERAGLLIDEIRTLVGGRDAEQLVQADESLTLGDRHLVIARAEVAIASGDAARAIELLGESVPEGIPRVALLHAQALTALGRWPEASSSLETARRDGRRQEARGLLWRIDAAEGAVHLGERRRLEARRSFEWARALAAQLLESVDDPALAEAFRGGIDVLAPPSPEPTPSQVAKAAFGGLTRRERDTAALVAQGKSNRAIARTLGIGERTVEGYVAATLSKLGFTSRAQIAVWAAEQGLPSAASTGRPRSGTP